MQPRSVSPSGAILAGSSGGLGTSGARRPGEALGQGAGRAAGAAGPRSISSSGCSSPATCRRPNRCSPTSRRCRPMSATPTASRSRASPASGGSSSPIEEYPPQLINAFLAAEDRTFFEPWRHRLSRPGRRGVRLCRQVGQRRARARRLDHHPAGRQESAARRRIFGHPQDPRGVPRPPHRDRC